jgi:ribonuclease HI
MGLPVRHDLTPGQASRVLDSSLLGSARAAIIAAAHRCSRKTVASKYYVVWAGRKPGIYTDWESCKRQVDQFPGARYKGFVSRAEAEAAFSGTPSRTPAAEQGGAAVPAAARSSASGTVKKLGSSVSAKTLRTWTAAEIAALPIQVKIFTDGGCEPNPGMSGSGLALYRGGALAELWYGLHSPRGTNNTAELNAFHQALRIASKEIQDGQTVAIFCDSKYAIQAVTQWAEGWKKKGWTKVGGEIKNLALIQEMYALHQTLKDQVKVMHVNGHVGVQGNELADRMSILARQTRTSEFVRYDDVLDIPEILAIV